MSASSISKRKQSDGSESSKRHASQESSLVRMSLPQPIRDTPMWFAELERHVREVQSLLQHCRRKAEKFQYKLSELELEARLGIFDHDSGHFVPGIPQPEFEQIFKQLQQQKQHCTIVEPWVKQVDKIDKEGNRYRFDNPASKIPTSVVQKRVLYRWTYRTSNGFGFRMAISTEVPRSLIHKIEVPTNMPLIRDKQRCRFVDTNMWSFDLSVVKENQEAKMLYEVECEWLSDPSLTTKVPLEKITWTLLYRMCLLCRSLRPGASQAEIVDPVGRTWPIRCWLV